MDGDVDGDGGERDGWIRSGGKKIIVHIVVYHLHIHTYIIQDAVGTLRSESCVSSRRRDWSAVPALCL
jgi:hypothetical protein